MERTRAALADAIRPFGPNGKLRAADVPFVDALADSLGLPPDEPPPQAIKRAAPIEGQLKPSPAALELVKEFEGLHEVRPDGKVEAYRCPSNVWTIGYGATGAGILLGALWTQQE